MLQCGCGLTGKEENEMNDERQSKSQRLVEAGIVSVCLIGFALTTPVFILVGCWAVKVLWKAAFG